MAYKSLVCSHEDSKRRGAKGSSVWISDDGTVYSTRGRCKLHCQKDTAHEKQRGMERDISRSTHGQTAWSIYLRGSPVLFHYMEAKELILFDCQLQNESVKSVYCCAN